MTAATLCGGNLHLRCVEPRASMRKRVSRCLLGSANEGTEEHLVLQFLPRGHSTLLLSIPEPGGTRNSVSGPRLLFDGPSVRLQRAPFTVREFVALQLKPGAVCLPPSIMGRAAGQCVDLSAWWGREADLAVDRMMATASPDTKLECLQDLVEANLFSQGYHDDICLEASTLIERGGGTMRGEDLEAKIGYSQRTIREIFATRLGFGPKQFSRICRMRRVIKLAHAEPCPSWADLAVQAGFSDQAHFIQEFRQMMGQRPTSFLYGARMAMAACTCADSAGHAADPMELGLAPWPRWLE